MKYWRLKSHINQTVWCNTPAYILIVIFIRVYVYIITLGNSIFKVQ